MRRHAAAEAGAGRRPHTLRAPLRARRWGGALVCTAATLVLPGLGARPAAAARPADAASSATTAPVGATPSDARARRTDVLIRIADLTDRMEDTEANVVAAQLEHDRLSDKASAVRQRVRARAVRAYIHGTGLGSSAATDLAAPSVYLEVTARKERELLTSLRTASAAAAQREDQADQARQGLRAVAVDLDRARAELDRLVAADDAKQLAARVAAEEAASQQAAADARRRAVAAAARSASDALGQARAGGADGSGLLPRHREATRRQADVMQRHPFGVLPAGPLPNAIAPTGEQFSGQASWYGPGFNGRPTASGAIYDEDGWTAASRTLPLGTLIVVSRNGVRVLLLVNDRGPYVDGRVLDLSAAAARALGVGVSQVDVEVVAPANGRL